MTTGEQVDEVASRRAGKGTGTSSRKPRAERWTEILTVATEVFFEKGYESASLHDIADRLDMLKGSLYYYIESKEDLLFAVVRTAHDELYQSVAALADGPGDAFDRLEQVIGGHIEFVCGNLARTRVFLHEMRSLPLERRQELLGSRHPYQTLLRGLIGEAKSSGLARQDVDTRLAALTLLGSLNWAYRWYHPTGDASPAQISRTIADLTIRGLATPPVMAARNDSQRPPSRTP